MVPFDRKNLGVRRVMLKACTTALGGSVSVVDRARSTKKREVYTRVPVPMAVARQFIKFYGVRRYVKAVPAALVYYDGHVVAVERHPGAGTASAKHADWTPVVLANLNKHLLPKTKVGEWKIDGQFVFRVDNTRGATNMSSDGRFKSIEVEAIKLSDLFLDQGGLTTETRACLQYTAGNGKSVMSPPIWKDLNRVGVRQINRSDSEDDDDEAPDMFAIKDEVKAQEQEHQFDRIDELLAVNLNFVLKAGKDLADLFGYDVIEPLRLDKLMVQLNTVNLPSLPHNVKQTFDTGLPFTYALAWLLGKLNQVDTLDSHRVIRGLIKQLTTKGIYRKNAFDDTAVYLAGSSHENVPLMTVEQAVEAAR